jgi:hypothetical protein
MLRACAYVCAQGAKDVRFKTINICTLLQGSLESTVAECAYCWQRVVNTTSSLGPKSGDAKIAIAAQVTLRLCHSVNRSGNKVQWSASICEIKPRRDWKALSLQLR